MSGAPLPLSRRDLLLGRLRDRVPSSSLRHAVARYDRAAPSLDPASHARVVRIDAMRCVPFCSVCMERCPEPGTVSMHPTGAAIDAARCTGCGLCLELCPSPAAPLSWERPARRPTLG